MYSATLRFNVTARHVSHFRKYSTHSNSQRRYSPLLRRRAARSHISLEFMAHGWLLAFTQTNIAHEQKTRRPRFLGTSNATAAVAFPRQERRLRDLGGLSVRKVRGSVSTVYTVGPFSPVHRCSRLSHAQPFVRIMRAPKHIPFDFCFDLSIRFHDCDLVSSFACEPKCTRWMRFFFFFR